MTRYLYAYVATLLVFCAVDYVWIGILMTDFYKTRLGEIMLAQPRLDAAAVFYLLYIAGLVYFGVRPGIAARSWKSAAFNGALFGVLAYATYDLTNLATLKGWQVDLTVIDMLWGGSVSALGAAAGYAASRLGRG